jgi:hypothetical protein
MQLITVPDSYSSEYIETTKCRPFFDKLHESLIVGVGKYPYYPLDASFSEAGVSKTENIFEKFKSHFLAYITSSTLNSVTNLQYSARNDIILGCTQYIDDLHIRHSEIQVIENEYNYHRRLKPDTQYRTIETLKPNVPLIISMPFSYTGSTYHSMDQLLDRCSELNIPVHIDGAWITAAKNTHIDFSHPAVYSLGISLSKGLGLSGWNRIGMRYTKERVEDSITVMNEFLQIPSVPVIVGTYFMEHVPIDHLWNTHGDKHYKICKDFNLTSSDTIHMATKDNNVLGLSNLLRYLENVQDS